MDVLQQRPARAPPLSFNEPLLTIPTMGIASVKPYPNVKGSFERCKPPSLDLSCGIGCRYQIANIQIKRIVQPRIKQNFSLPCVASAFAGYVNVLPINHRVNRDFSSWTIGCNKSW